MVDHYGAKKHPQAEIISSWTVQRQPTDLSILDFVGRVKPYGYYISGDFLILEMRYIRPKPFDPFEFVQRHNETKEEFQARINKRPEFEPAIEVKCMCRFPEILLETQEVRIDAYVDGSLIIEQYTQQDLELRRALTKEALSVVSDSQGK